MLKNLCSIKFTLQNVLFQWAIAGLFFVYFHSFKTICRTVHFSRIRTCIVGVEGKQAGSCSRGCHAQADLSAPFILWFRDWILIEHNIYLWFAFIYSYNLKLYFHWIVKKRKLKKKRPSRDNFVVKVSINSFLLACFYLFSSFQYSWR